MANDAVMQNMMKMIQTMMPYDYEYRPVTPSGQTIFEILALLSEKNPKIGEFAGFIGHVLKKMEADENLRDSKYVDVALMEIWVVINKHYPPMEKQ